MFVEAAAVASTTGRIGTTMFEGSSEARAVAIAGVGLDYREYNTVQYTKIHHVYCKVSDIRHNTQQSVTSYTHSRTVGTLLHRACHHNFSDNRISVTEQLHQIMFPREKKQSHQYAIAGWLIPWVSSPSVCRDIYHIASLPR